MKCKPEHSAGECAVLSSRGSMCKRTLKCAFSVKETQRQDGGTYSCSWKSKNVYFQKSCKDSREVLVRTIGQMKRQFPYNPSIGCKEQKLGSFL